MCCVVCKNCCRCCDSTIQRWGYMLQICKFYLLFRMILDNFAKPVH